MNTPYEKYAKIYTNCSGHMTKMVDIPIYGKTPKDLLKNQKASDLRTWDLVCSIRDVGPTKFVQIMILG